MKTKKIDGEEYFFIMVYVNGNWELAGTEEEFLYFTTKQERDAHHTIWRKAKTVEEALEQYEQI